MSNIKLYNIDCMEYMSKCKDKQFDLTFTDPPYNVNIKYNSYNDNNANYYDWCDKWFNELLRISKCIVLTTGYKNCKYWYNKDPKHVLIWYKKNQNSPSPVGGFNVYEPIFIFGKGHKRIGHDLIQTNISLQKNADFHPCPKHLQSWKIILNKIAVKDSKIFDPFLGSGTTALACHDLNFDLVGTEIDKEYYDSMMKRFNIHKQQLTFF